MKTETTYCSDMNLSLDTLTEALSIREEIDSLERRLSAMLTVDGEISKPPVERRSGNRSFSAATRAKLSAAAKARWAKQKGGATLLSSVVVAGETRKERGLTPEGRRRLSEAMKARWAVRRSAKAKRR
jgi:hypothetical protein